MWRQTMAGSRVPRLVAASTYDSLRTPRITLRTMRTTRGISGTEMAISTVASVAPDRATRAIASRMPGIAIMPSITRMMMASARRKYPAAMPMIRPSVTLMSTTPAPTTSETRAP